MAPQELRVASAEEAAFLHHLHKAEKQNELRSKEKWDGQRMSGSLKRQNEKDDAL